MIFVIGGPPRVGKTRLAQRLAQEDGIGWISTDVVREVVAVAQPDLTGPAWWDPDAHAVYARRFFPFLEALAVACDADADAYVIEGVEFLPEQVAALRGRLDVRACFVGASDVTLAQLEEHSATDSWIFTELSAPERAKLPEQIVACSRFVADECAAHGIAYVDLACGYDAATQEVLRVLRASGPGPT